MSEPYPDPDQIIRRDNKSRRGIDPDFHYSSQRFATVAALAKNLPHFVKIIGIDFVGVLLLTFRRPIGMKAARRAFNNIWRRFFREIFGHWISVVEFTKAGRVHFHIIVQCLQDIRTGFHFFSYRAYVMANESAGAIGHPLTIKARRELRDAIPCNENLRQCWQHLDNGLTDFDFGAVYDLFPIETDAVTLRKYVSKQFFSGLPHQGAAEKGVRVVTYSRGCPRAVPPGWRPPSPWFEARLAALLRCCGMRSREDLKRRLSVRYWAYSILCLIRELNIELPQVWPAWPADVLAGVVVAMILDNPYFNQNLGALLPDLNRVIAAALDVPPSLSPQVDPVRRFPAPSGCLPQSCPPPPLGMVAVEVSP